MDGEAYAWDLLENGVLVMPDAAFGNSLKDWIRVALTIDDDSLAKALDRMVVHANNKTLSAAEA